MDSTLMAVIASIIIFLVLFFMLFLSRERVEVQVDEDCLLLRYPFKKRKIDLQQELVSWKVQEAFLLRLGMVYSINMLFRNGKRVGLSSRFNQENYDKLYAHLDTHYDTIREYED